MITTKQTIIATDKEHLQQLINDEINNQGNKCSLNHIDVSKVTDMSYLFYNSKFNGNINNWNVSNIVNMTYMFKDCPAINPWWYIEDNDLRQIAINKFNLMNKLNTDLSPSSKKLKKLKI